ncbi:MAG TPA: hypothetical protein VNY51_04385 [Candidatus Dormibacteraeota bacterium]|nr:hypothetical protein [Candidatus Dormibacteraeota bacterium]
MRSHAPDLIHLAASLRTVTGTMNLAKLRTDILYLLSGNVQILTTGGR